MPLPSEPSYPDAKSHTSFGDGIEFQDFVCVELARRGFVVQCFSSKRYQFAVGESLTGAEIKLDTRCTETGRLSIEVAEKTRCSLDWVSSGIAKEDNAWLYIQGNRDVLFIFAKNWLCRYFVEKGPEVVENRPTIRSFFLPIEDAYRYAAKAIDLRVGLKSP